MIHKLFGYVNGQNFINGGTLEFGGKKSFMARLAGI